MNENLTDLVNDLVDRGYATDFNLFDQIKSGKKMRSNFRQEIFRLMKFTVLRNPRKTMTGDLTISLCSPDFIIKTA